MTNKIKKNKLISNFDYTPGLQIDLADQPCSIFIDPKSSIIFMEEGDGDNRINGAVVFPKDKPSFRVGEIKNGGQIEMYLNVQNKHYLLGHLAIQALLSEAYKWCEKANEQIINHNLELSKQSS